MTHRFKPGDLAVIRGAENHCLADELNGAIVEIDSEAEPCNVHPYPLGYRVKGIDYPIRIAAYLLFPIDHDPGSWDELADIWTPSVAETVTVRTEHPLSKTSAEWLEWLGQND